MLAIIKLACFFAAGTRAFLFDTDVPSPWADELEAWISSEAEVVMSAPVATKLTPGHLLRNISIAPSGGSAPLTSTSWAGFEPGLRHYRVAQVKIL